MSRLGGGHPGHGQREQHPHRDLHLDSVRELGTVTFYILNILKTTINFTFSILSFKRKIYSNMFYIFLSYNLIKLLMWVGSILLSEHVVRCECFRWDLPKLRLVWVWGGEQCGMFSPFKSPSHWHTLTCCNPSISVSKLNMDVHRKKMKIIHL